MTQTANKRLLALTVASLGVCLISGGVVLAQTKQLKDPASAPKVVAGSQEESNSQNTINLTAQDGNSSYSVVIENHTTPDGKVIQSKKVWSNGNLIQEEEKELDANEANNSLSATIQLPNGQIAPGGIFQSEDDENIFGDANSPFEALRKMEEQMRLQEERMRAQFDALRNRIANGQPSNDPAPQALQIQPSTEPSKYWIGLTIGMLPEILVNQMPIDENEGVLIQYVVPDSPADKIGLKRYDVLHSINGQVVSGPVEVTKLIEKLGAQKVKVEYYRKGKLENAEIEIEERPQTLSSQFNLGAPLQNKQFHVVRPGLIVPSEELDESGTNVEESSQTTATDAQTDNTSETESTKDDSLQLEKTE